MLTGEQLGGAIEAARKMKGVTKRALATHFGVKPPSIQDWVKRGTIEKQRLPELWAYFADVVGPDHWGLPAGHQVASPMPAGATHPPAPPTLAEALPVVLEALGAIPALRWPAVQATLAQMAGHPEMRDDLVGELLPLLAPAQAAPRKHGT